MIEAKIDALTAAIERLILVMDRAVIAPDLSPKAPDVPKAARATKAVKAAEAVETEAPSPVYTAPDEVAEINPVSVARPTPPSALPDIEALRAVCLSKVQKNRDRDMKALILELIIAHSDGRGELLVDIPPDNLSAFADALAAL